MDIRYSHPEVTELWSPGWTYAAWLAIETRTLVHQRNVKVVPAELTEKLQQYLFDIGVQDADIDRIQLIEEETRHDVVAFLQWLRGGINQSEGVFHSMCDQASPCSETCGIPADVGKWIHFGLTSSDVVDTAQGMRFREMHPVVLEALGRLVASLGDWTNNQTPITARTHGQVAEPMTMRARAFGWLELVAPCAADLSRSTNRMAVCKLSGPVGTYAHNPRTIELSVAKDLNLRPHGLGATQIASRAPLAAWSNAANLVVQACAKIAHDIRLMTLLGETQTIMEEGQVGSSSMAHKQNPIRAERIAGMARMATGYNHMLADLGTWLERDISMSSVERVAVPDLWHTTLFVIEETTALLKQMMVKHSIVRGEAFVSWMTQRGIDERGMSLEDAREWAMVQSRIHPFDARVDPNAVLPQTADFMRNYG